MTFKAQLRISDAERDAGEPLQETVARGSSLFLDQGYLVLENALPRDFVASLQRAFLGGPAGRLDQAALRLHGRGVGDGRVILPLTLSPPFDTPSFWAHPIFCALLETWLGPTFMLDACTVVISFPGAQEQEAHRDNFLPYPKDRVSLRMPPFAISLAMPLIDLDQQTGTTEIFEGSHQQMYWLRSEHGKNGVRPYLRLGDVYFMDYRLIHLGTANTSQQRRPIIYLIYTRSWYCDSQSHLEKGLPSLLVPPATRANLPPRLAQMLLRAQPPESADPGSL